jgi:hypothetical protein
MRLSGTTFDAVRRTFAVGVTVDPSPSAPVEATSGMTITLAVRQADVAGAPFLNAVMAESGDRLEFRLLYAAIGNAPVTDVVLRTDLHRALLFALGSGDSPMPAMLTCPSGSDVAVSVIRDAQLVIDLASACGTTSLPAGDGGEVRFFVSVP